MAEQISQRELRSDTHRIMRALDEGRNFVVTRNGRPVAELRPYGRRHFVSSTAAVEIFRHAPPVGWPRLRWDLDEVVDQTIDPPD